MLRIAHRGASAYVPENTLGAFARGLAMAADGVELDVHRCKSGEPVVIHDDTVDRTTHGHGKVAELTLAELKALRTANNETIPTLDEALDALAGKYCFVEIKHDDAAMLAAAAIARSVKAGQPKGTFWLISFRHEALRAAQREYPALYTGASFERLSASSIKEAHAWGARAIIPHHKSFSAKQVQEAQALGLKVICWTVNEPSDIARLKAMNVDGIISDYPDRLHPS